MCGLEWRKKQKQLRPCLLDFVIMLFTVRYKGLFFAGQAEVCIGTILGVYFYFLIHFYSIILER